MIEILDYEHEAMRRVARSVVWRFRHVEYDDVHQELALWVCENYSRIRRWRAQMPDVEPLFFYALRKRAHEYVRAEQARGATREGLPPYPRPWVKASLPFAFGKTDAESTPEIRAVLPDVVYGLHEISWRDRGVLEAAVDYGYDYGAIASVFSDEAIGFTLTPAAAKKRVQRATTRLLSAMDRDDVPVGYVSIDPERLAS